MEPQQKSGFLNTLSKLFNKFVSFLKNLGNFGHKKGGNIFIGTLLFIVVFRIALILLKGIIGLLCSKEKYCVENYKKEGFVGDIVDTIKMVFGLNRNKKIKSADNINDWNLEKKKLFQNKLYMYFETHVLPNYKNDDVDVLKNNLNVIAECLTHALAGSINYNESDKQFDLLQQRSASNTIIGFTLQRCIEYNGFLDHKSIILSSLNVNNTAEKFKEYFIKENYSDKKMINNAMERINMRLNSVDKEIQKTSANVDNFLKKSK